MIVPKCSRALVFGAVGWILVVSGSVQNAHAGIAYRVDKVVHGQTGGFGHSLFHSARTITGGARLGYFDLNPNSPPSTNYYAPNSGVLRFEGDVFSDASLTDLIGVFSASSDNLYASDLGDNDWNGDLVGTIDFDITFFDTNSAFFNYMSDELGSTDSTFSRSLNFVDRQYGGVEPLFANSLDLDAGLLTLWGADGPVNGAGNFGRSILGSDIVLALVTAPEPTSMALWALAGSCCFGAYRRRRA